MFDQGKPADLGDVTVIIPAYRAGDTVAKAIRSALQQRNDTAKIIVVVDGGFVDGHLKDFARRCDRIKIIENSVNMGASESRNIGLASAETEFVHFLDADDYLIGDVVGNSIGLMQKMTADVGFAPSIQWSRRRGFYGHTIPDYRDHAHIFWLWMSVKRNVTTCSITWRRSYLLRIGGWKEGLRRNQDTELALRAILLGANFTGSAEGCGVWCHRESANRITARTDNLDAPLEVVEGFLALESSVVPKEVRDLACAHYLYYLAHKAFAAGAVSVGRQALAKSRSLGFDDHLGDKPHVFLSRLFGLERKQRLVRLLKRNWREWFGRR